MFRIMKQNEANNIGQKIKIEGVLFPSPSTFSAKGWIKMQLDKLHTPKLVKHVSLLPLKIKQNQTAYICDRILHHKPFLLSVENEFYILVLHVAAHYCFLTHSF